MKRFAMILSAALALAAGDPSAGSAQTPSPSAFENLMTQYRNKNRVLLVFAPTAQDAAFREQNKLWMDERGELTERQLVILPLLADAKEHEIAAVDHAFVTALAKKFGQDTKAFGVVLVGKDGHDAYRSAKPVKPETLYGVIDVMPIRRAEMKRAQTTVAPTPTPTPHKPDLDHDE